MLKDTSKKKIAKKICQRAERLDIYENAVTCESRYRINLANKIYELSLCSTILQTGKILFFLVPFYITALLWHNQRMFIRLWCPFCAGTVSPSSFLLLQKKSHFCQLKLLFESKLQYTGPEYDKFSLLMLFSLIFTLPYAELFCLTLHSTLI